MLGKEECQVIQIYCAIVGSLLFSSIQRAFNSIPIPWQYALLLKIAYSKCDCDLRGGSLSTEQSRSTYSRYDDISTQPMKEITDCCRKMYGNVWISGWACLLWRF